VEEFWAEEFPVMRQTDEPLDPAGGVGVMDREPCQVPHWKQEYARQEKSRRPKVEKGDERAPPHRHPILPSDLLFTQDPSGRHSEAGLLVYLCRGSVQGILDRGLPEECLHEMLIQHLQELSGPGDQRTEEEFYLIGAIP